MSAFDDVLTTLIRNVVREEIRAALDEKRQCSPLSDGDGKRYLSRDAVAKRLDVSKATIDRWIKQGTIEAMKVGRRVLVDPSSIVDADRVAARVVTGLHAIPDPGD